MEYVKTIREMLTSPENVIDSFVLKEDVNFQHPFLFGLISFVLLIILNSFLVDFNIQLQASPVSGESEQLGQLNYWIRYANLKVSTQFLPLSMFLLFVPSLTLPGLFFFRDSIDGFYYNLILNCYAVATSLLALALMIPFWFINGVSVINSPQNIYLPVVFSGLIILWIYKKYFHLEDARPWIQVASSFTLGCIIFFLLKSFSVSIIGYFIFAVNRFLDIWMSV